jgi:hypothetical protein
MPQVRGWLEPVVWLLALHSQTRILSVLAMSLFVPLGRGWAEAGATFCSFYGLAAPLAAAMALGGQRPMATRLAWCVRACVCAAAAAWPPPPLSSQPHGQPPHSMLHCTPTPRRRSTAWLH